MYLIKLLAVPILAGAIGLVTFFGHSEGSRLATPKNVEVGDIVKSGELDLCKEYKESTEKEDVEKAQIQEIIGYQNNKFGLYIYRVDDFAKKAAELANSNGGDWGYALIPYNVKDYDTSKWNSFFDVLNEYHLIPIIQLWDVSKDPNDAINETRDAAEYLNSLNWPIKNRYISAYNEVNDEKFWKNGIDPEGYAKLLDETINIFKEQNKDFFIMNGAFNASARTGGGYLDEQEYLKRMDQEVPGIFKRLDGWATHPYPHINGYLGTPKDTGRNSIRAYEWELELLQKLFDVRNIPVFITETGWPHAEGENYNTAFVSEEVAAEYIKQAFTEVWLNDDRIVAVTPFTIKYDPPHDHFSWIKKDGSNYKQFDVLKEMKKIAGKPPVVEVYDPLKEKCKVLME